MMLVTRTGVPRRSQRSIRLKWFTKALVAPYTLPHLKARLPATEPMLTFDHAGQDAAGAVQQSVDVGGDHFVPVVHVARLSGVLADGAARVVQQHVDVLEPFGKVGKHFHHDVTLGDVETEGEEISAQFGGEFVEAGLAAAGADDLPAFLDEAAGGFAADTGGDAGDEDDFLGHV